MRKKLLIVVLLLLVSSKYVIAQSALQSRSAKTPEVHENLIGAVDELPSLVSPTAAVPKSETVAARAVSTRAVSTKEGSPLSLERVIKTVLSLVAVCGLAVLVLGILGKRVGAVGRLFSGKDSGKRRARMSVSERVFLTKNESLVLVQCGDGRELLISVGVRGSVLLGVIDCDGKLRLLSSDEDREQENDEGEQPDASDSREDVVRKIFGGK